MAQMQTESAGSLGYDANGNLTTYKGWAYTYDAQNRLTSATNGTTTAQFYYDGKNRQIARNIGGVVRFSSWDGWELLEEYGSGLAVATFYIQGNTGVIRSSSPSGTFYYYQDKLGSTTHVANASGQLVESYKYDVYGTPSYFSSTSQPLNSSTVGVADLYAGERWIPQLGLYDLRNRSMSPELGRFLQSDPIGFKGDASNLYRYCHNDPEDFADSTGLLDTSAAIWHRLAIFDSASSSQESLEQLDLAAGINSPPIDGHVTIEKPAIFNDNVDRARKDSQLAKDVDDEHFGDRGGAVADGQAPGLTTAHTFTSSNAVVRPVIYSQYGRYWDPGSGNLRPYGQQWRALARVGEREHQSEIAYRLRPERLQKAADAAFAHGGIPQLRKVMNAFTSQAVMRSGLAHDGPYGDHHLFKQPQTTIYPEPLSYDQ